ncbi:hypothetical protein FVA96_24200 [Escherichia coli]|nr:hypothetical protein [Escherichia coli]
MMLLTHSDSTNEADWRREWEGEVLLSHNTNLSGGVGFLFSRSFKPVSLEVKHIIEGRLFLVKARFDLFTVVFINVYAPTIGTERKLFLTKVNDLLDGCAPEDFLFLGGILTVHKTRLQTQPRRATSSFPARSEAAGPVSWPGGCVEKDACRLPTVHVVPPQRR